MAQIDDMTSARLMTTEYERIKEEQKTRIGFRDNLIYATLASMAAVISATLSAHDTAYLLLLPPVSVVLGWTYLVNDEKISSIGRYVRTELAPRLMEATGESAPVFGWESAHRSDRYRISRKYSQLIVDLVTFCLAPSVAFAIFWSSSSVTALLMVASIAEAVFVGGLLVQIVLYADLKM
ncbi:hypothetical protein AB0C21_08445 [Spirillospora sp. NPDC049024]